MPTDVIMPQMGESIFEGAITKWLKKPGDRVQRDEPLFEISTDKVDAEIPSPASGILTEVKAAEGTTVAVNTVVGVISEEGAAPPPTKPGSSAAAPAREAKAPGAPSPAGSSTAAPSAAESSTGKPSAVQPSGGTAAGGASGAQVNVVMPQMGESIFEGTITKWLKKPGDAVTKDEPLFEISTDKVDAEIPAPESGTLIEIKAQAGATVAINAVVAVIGGAAGAGSAGAVAAAPAVEEAQTAPSSPSATAGAGAPQATEPTAESAPGERVRSSPLVRRIVKENHLDLSQIPATGLGGRVTKQDVLGFMAQGDQAAAPAAPAPAALAPRGPAPTETRGPGAPDKTEAPQPAALPTIPPEPVPMSRMRSIIAQRMVESKHTSAHVHSVFKIDMTRIVRIREREKAKYEQRNGVKLTYMPFISRAVIVTLRKMPIVNASLDGASIRYHQHVNLGIAVALDWGLIVPVIPRAEERNFLGLARAIADLAARARGKKLKPEETSGGTFTITNPGIFGEQFGTPVINQPEAAILGVGGLFKEPTVVTDQNGDDSIAVRSVIRLTLGFDHRIIDGADAGRFLAEVKKYLENWSEDIG